MARFDSSPEDVGVKMSVDVSAATGADGGGEFRTKEKDLASWGKMSSGNESMSNASVSVSVSFPHHHEGAVFFPQP